MNIMKLRLNNSISFKLVCILVIGLGISSCATISERSHTDSSSPATLTPFNNEWGVQIYIDELDGSKVKYSELDRLALDGGTHDLRVRMEYQPASGTSLVVGGLGNLLLRAGSNKTFEHNITVEMIEGHNYGLTVKGTDSGFELLVFDESVGGIVTLEHQFEYKDGGFERLF
jgi:hypothetical protein